MPMDLQIGDVLTLKKPHACGANEWAIYRLGVDIGLRCKSCNRLVMLPRVQVERRIRLITRNGESFNPRSQKGQKPAEMP
jgi:hypothetical protein